ncbi:MAG TPA: chemotaxis protein CheW [Opitutaceae bacterium]|nr:chemotaxis protein CheW [Opitutaceae bacterium]
MHSSADTPGTAGKYLTVLLADESYGIAVLKVREIVRLQKITAVPQMPACVKGVINLRGRVVPVIDLRVKFGLVAAMSERTCIVVVHVGRESQRSIPLGLIVDTVEEVVSLSDADIAPTPSFGGAVHPEYLLGMAKGKDRVKTLIDIDRVLLGETIDRLAAA